MQHATLPRDRRRNTWDIVGVERLEMRVVDRSYGIRPNAPWPKVKHLKLQELPPDRRAQAERHLPIHSAFLESHPNEVFMSADPGPDLSGLYATALRDEREVGGEASGWQ